VSTRLLLTAALTSFVMAGLFVWLRNNYQPVAVGGVGSARVQARAFRGSIVGTAAVGVGCLVAAAIVSVF
jgi:hypothetical protein